MQSLTLIQEISIAILPILLAITVHEAAHGLAADKLGDHTARMAGRVTINPLKHIDLFGTIILPIGMYAISGFMFGWAKPVPVNWKNLRNPRRDTALVALAGPMANFGMLLLWTIALVISVSLPENVSWLAVPLRYMANFGILINAILMALNLLPILPLDGGRVFNSILPAKLSVLYSKTEPWGFFVLIALLLTNLLSAILMPLVGFLRLLSMQIIGIIL